MSYKSWIDTSSLDMNNEGISSIVAETNKKLSDFDKNHFVCEDGGKFFVYTEKTNEDDKFMLTRLSYKDFAFRYNCNDIYVPSGKKDSLFTKKGIASYWMSCPQKRTFNGIIFNPKYSGKNFYNLWRGFKITSDCDGEFSHIERHLKEVWCNGNEEHYSYLIKWFAHMIQYPSKKAGVALVIKGEKGTGKTGFISKLAEKILGEHYMLVSSSHDIYGNFNSQQYAKLLITFDEAIWNGGKSMEGRLKSLITDTNILIEKKGMDAEIKKNYSRYILLTNEKFSVPATYDERRFFALRISNERRNDIKYFDELYKAMEHEIDNFFGFLKKFDLCEEDVFTPPATSALFEDVFAGMDFFDQWLFNLIDGYVIKQENSFYLWDNSIEKIGFNKHVRTKTLFDNFMESKERSGQSSFIHTVTKFTQKMSNGKRDSYSFIYRKCEGQNCIFLPSIDEAKKIYEKKFSCIVEWTELNESTRVLNYKETLELLKKGLGKKYRQKDAIKTAYHMYKDKQFAEEFGQIFGSNTSGAA
ncbi:MULTISPECIES: primase-helicase family protein [unclassified Desulfovibrio]|uniref:primase-helicase family protein n=1 Tax=unclassified Desulfovibrio TaxID=2593640 RepID=UPI002FDB23AB